MSENLATYLGESKTFTIPLELDGSSFTPGTDYTLYFACKEYLDDAPEDSKIEKTTGNGLTHSGSTALVELVFEDSNTLDDKAYFYAIRAQHNTTGAWITLQTGKLRFRKAPPDEPTVSVPINTTQPAARILPSGGTTGQVLTKTSGTNYAVQWSTPTTGDSLNGNTLTAGTGTLTLGSYTLTVSGTATVSGTNTGDQDLSSYAPLVSPSFTTPSLGAATAGTINNVSITTNQASAALYVGGSIDTRSLSGTNLGGSITTTGETGAAGGYINTSGAIGIAGGNINTSIGGSINTSDGGGNIFTFGGGGNIDTTAGGSLTTGTGNLTGPNTSGTIALTSDLYVRTAQIVVTELTADFSTAATIPYDASIPQSGEGAEYITAAITPINAGSTLEIEAHLMVGGSAGGMIIAALFKDSDADAIETECLGSPGGNSMYPFVFRARVSAASTSARTYKLRIGSNGITVYVNRISGTADLFGASVVSRLIVRELLFP